MLRFKKKKCKLYILTAVVCLLWMATSASAQSVVLNPTKVIFTASADHNTVVGGVALVERYELRHYLVGATSPVQTQDLGKPTLDNGKCTGNVASLPLSTTAQYAAKVVAIGPTGEGVSAFSTNTYFFVGPPATPASVSLSK
jgi:hypothetical protein